MFSRILLRLIDQAIVPALVLIATRVVSIVLVSKYLNYSFSLNPTGFSFSGLDQYKLVNSYSVLFMLIVLSSEASYILVKSYIFHDSHIKPYLTAKMFTIKMPSLIQSSFEIYSQGIVWLSYSYLILIVSGVMSLFRLLQPWVFYTGTALVLATTVLLVFDVEKEIEINKQKESVFDEDTEYLENEEDKEK